VADGISIADSLGSSFDLSILDGTIINDGINLTGAPVLDNSTVIVDGTSVVDDLHVNDDITVSSSLANSDGVSISDGITLANTLANTDGISIADSIAISDAIALSNTLGTSDSIGFSDTLDIDNGMAVSNSAHNHIVSAATTVAVHPTSGDASAVFDLSGTTYFTLWTGGYYNGMFISTEIKSYLPTSGSGSAYLCVTSLLESIGEGGAIIKGISGGNSTADFALAANNGVNTQKFPITFHPTEIDVRYGAYWTGVENRYCKTCRIYEVWIEYTGSDVTGDTTQVVTLSGDVTRGGAVTQYGTVDLTGGVTKDGTVTKSGTVTRLGNVVLTGNVTRSGTVSKDGTVTLSGGVTKSGTASRSGSVTKDGTVSQAGTLSLSGSVVKEGTVTRGGSVSLTGGVALAGGVSKEETVTRSGGVSLFGGVALTGDITEDGAVTKTGTVTQEGTVSLIGGVAKNGTVTKTGTVTQAGTVSLTGGVAKNGAATRLGSVSKSGTVSRSGLVTKDGAVTLSGNSVSDVEIGSVVTAHCLGHLDDQYGTVTGTPYALVHRPDHVLRHLWAGYLGRSLDDFADDCGPYFEAAGYSFSFLISSPIWARDLFDRLAFQCRSWFLICPHGIANLRLRTVGPAAVKTIDRNEIKMDSVSYSRTPNEEIVNAFSFNYNLDQRYPPTAPTSYRGTLSVVSPGSIDTYGWRDYSGEMSVFCFSAIRDEAMAIDVADFYLSWAHRPRRIPEFSVFLDNVNIQQGDNILLYHPLDAEAGLSCAVVSVRHELGSGADSRADSLRVVAVEKSI